MWNVWKDVKPLTFPVFWFSNQGISFSLSFRILKQGAAGNVIVLQPTKTAMTFCDIDPGRWIDVPACGFSSSWHGAKPRTPHTNIAGLPQSGFFVVLHPYLFNFFRTSFERFSPTFRSEGMDDYWKPLVRASESRTSLYLTIIPGITSRWTPLVHYRIWFCMHGIQFPTDPVKDPFPILCVRVYQVSYYSYLDIQGKKPALPLWP